MQLLEELKNHSRSRLVLTGFFVFLFLGALLFALALKPVLAKDGQKILFKVSSGDGFRDVADALEKYGLIRSDIATKAYLLFSGAAFHLQPGMYLLNKNLSAQEITRIIRDGQEEVRVVIPEGYSIYDIDDTLAENYVLAPGALIAWAKEQKLTATRGEPAESIEGRLFPDTYNFFLNSTTSDVAGKMLANFTAKAESLLPKGDAEAKKALIIASILEKEVPDFKDRQMVAGIILKRLKVGMPVQVDATICYLKRMEGEKSCYPLNPLDFKADSPYNTYLYRGLPPSPIGNPGTSAIQAAITPIQSNYWFYLSDPATGKTIFSETLDKHASNRQQYLKK